MNKLLQNENKMLSNHKGEWGFHTFVCQKETNDFDEKFCNFVA